MVIAKPRPRIPDCIATVDEDWHAWYKCNQNIAQARGLERVQRAQVQGQEGFDDQSTVKVLLPGKGRNKIDHKCAAVQVQHFKFLRSILDRF